MKCFEDGDDTDMIPEYCFIACISQVFYMKK